MRLLLILKYINMLILQFKAYQINYVLKNGEYSWVKAPWYKKKYTSWKDYKESQKYVDVAKSIKNKAKHLPWSQVNSYTAAQRPYMLVRRHNNDLNTEFETLYQLNGEAQLSYIKKGH